MNHEELIAELEARASPANVAGMARYGINPTRALGIAIPVLRALAKKAGQDHALAQRLWTSGIHEARILAAFVGDPRQVNETQMEEWVGAFDSWDVCDQVCANLFDRTPFAFAKAAEWSRRQEEFIRRAGFALMAALAWHDKGARDSQFTPFFALIQEAATDERNFVKKAVNWALRQIGKRSPALLQEAVRCARELQRAESRAARWIAADALREWQRKGLSEHVEPPGAAVP